MRLLLAEDELSLSKALKAILERNKYSVDAVYDGQEALDYLNAENTEDATKGFIYIAGGTFAAQADGDGISASAYIQIDAGNFSITTGEGSASVKTERMSDPRQQEQTETEDTDSTSQKGIKSGTALTINGGTFVTDTVDDSMHAGRTMT